MEVRIQHLQPIRVVARLHEGPYEGLADAIDRLVGWLRSHKETGGAVTTVFPDPAHLEAGLPDAHEHPPQNENPDHATGPRIDAEIWVQASDRIEEAAREEEETSLKDVDATDAACVTHTGDPLEIPRLALALRAFLQKSGYTVKPETRVLHLMPDWEDPVNWVAEVQVPLLRAGDGAS